jgi:hypothetical protein
VLGRNDRLDDVGDIVYIGEGLDAEENVVEGLLRRMGGIFGRSDDYRGSAREGCDGEVRGVPA